MEGGGGGGVAEVRKERMKKNEMKKERKNSDMTKKRKCKRNEGQFNTMCINIIIFVFDTLYLLLRCCLIKIVMFYIVGL